MKKNIIISIATIIIIGLLAFIAFTTYQTKQAANFSAQVLNAIVSKDKDGIAGFTRLFAESLQAINTPAK
jgi:hypothetical protein